MTSLEKKLFIRTPLLESYPLSKMANFRVFLKMENTQPTDSFKLRGISFHMQKLMREGATRFVASSGGNAGVAAAYVARKLQTPITVYVPETTPEAMRARISGEGANVIVHGKAWDHAEAKAQEMSKEPGCAYVSPFDHPDIWKGHSTMIAEAAEDLPDKPDVVVVSVGGGGLYCGVVEGMKEIGWSDVPIITMETIGADCFNKAIKAGHLVTLPDITSLAKCLGALTAGEKAFEYQKERETISEVIPDIECIDAVSRFLDDHRVLVEPACGAALASVYSNTINNLQKAGKLGEIKSALIIVCGGHMVTYQRLLDWKKQVGMV